MFQGGIGEKLWMKKGVVIITVVYSTHKKLHNEVGSGGNVNSAQAQAASS